ncbi:hypothetical protein [Lacipirellula parvula]|uniref:Uncharacterized protein n=1 Tax=Lacipirellula parvula TaxID=2650471 RepID=A0A5K7XLK7_9BACT|nr:hypothetical protein [Lacipirellula parvula]BBO35536.1 hypothetical protein PLANPX_5148 [Lacipirellula parvula]
MKTVVITYHPSSNTFDFVADRPYLHADHYHARLWLRGDGLPRRRIRELLQIAFVLGHLGESLIIK